MKFICNSDVLNSAAQMASKAAGTKGTALSPALSGILIEAAQDSLKLTGYNLKTGIQTIISAAVTEPGSIVMDSKTFAEIAKSLPIGKVEIKSNSTNVEINCMGHKFSMAGMEAAEDFPELPEVNENGGIMLRQSMLKNMIHKTAYAVSTNESRPIYTGELFEIEDDLLHVVALDGYRIACRREHISDHCDSSEKFVVPGDSLLILEKLLKDSDGKVSISIGDKHIVFTFDDTTVISRRLDGDFMDYRILINLPFTGEAIVDRQEFLQCIQRVMLLIDEKVRQPVRFRFNGEKVHIFCNTPKGSAESACDIGGNVDNLEIGFNGNYLCEALKNISDDKIKIKLVGGAKPCVIVPVGEDEDFICMILPVRLKAE